MMKTMRYAFAILVCLMAAGAARAEPAFDAFLQATWPDAHSLGVSRVTFDKAIRGLEPDLALPDLALPGRPETAAAAARIRADAGAISARTDVCAACRAGQKIRSQYRDTLTRIEKDFGVPGNVVLAIWARETDYGAEQPAARRAAACWRRRPMSASARISSATNSCTR